MAFFDDLGKKLSQAGQTAVQKTKEMTDIARLNGAISEQEKKVSDTYFEIGKLYVLKHPGDYDNDFAPMLAALKDSENKIKEYRQQIQDIKGVVRCEKCGAEIVNNVAFCSSCGAKAPVVSKVETNETLVKCSGCGAMVDKNAKFCTVCGKVMPETSNVSELQGEHGELSNNNVCSVCGAEMAENVLFCTQCGNKKH